jgi:predicted nucleotide-binding protein
MRCRMMTTHPIVDQEFVAHFFAPMDGPQADEAYRQVRRMWEACRRQLGMTEPIPQLLAPVLAPERLPRLPADGVVAAQESPASNRQSILRLVHDVLNLSVALAQPAPEGRRSRPPGPPTPVPPARMPAQSRLEWADLAQIWAQASRPGADAMLGEARLFLARTPPGDTGAVTATPELGKSLDSLLPYAADRPRDWWRWGVTTAEGYALWDTRLAADTSGIREIVLIAAADRDDELSAWAWSDGTAAIPPFAQYLLHAAKLRYEARLLDAWHRSSGVQRGLDEVPEELSASTLTSDAPHPVKAESVRSGFSRATAEAMRLSELEAELRRLRQTATIARDNLRAAVPRDVSYDSAGMFEADQALAQWLLWQADDDLIYLRINIDRVNHVRTLAAEELEQLEHAVPAKDRSHAPGSNPEMSASAVQPSDATAAPDVAAQVARRVFIVYGRDSTLAKRFHDLLRAVYLEPLEWEILVEATRSAAPYLGQVVARAPHLAQATLVLLTPDDVVELHSDLFLDNDTPQERARSGQARPNVLFELGLALMAYPERTVVVEIGQMRPVADLAGLNVIRFDGSAPAIKKVLDRLKRAGCPVNDSGTDWLDPARFAGLAAYQRGPDTHDGGRAPTTGPQMA